MRNPDKRAKTRLSDVETIMLGEAPDPRLGAPDARGLPVEPAVVPAGYTRHHGRRSQRKCEPTARSAGELGKTDCCGVALEDRVHVLEKGVTNDPRWDTFAAAADRVPNVENSATTHFVCATPADGADVHISSADGPVGTAEREGNGNGGAACCLSKEIL